MGYIFYMGVDLSIRGRREVRLPPSKGFRSGNEPKVQGRDSERFLKGGHQKRKEM